MSPLALSLRFLQAQPDARLVELARDGHEPAFEALVRRYRKELLAYCRRLQPHSGGAEDALQQALLQAWRALSAGVEVREVRPWLYRIAHNVTVNSLRCRVAIPHEIGDAEAREEVEELVQQRLRARAALVGMASLPDVQRQVFISATLDGASHEEVASALGLSSGAVRGLIYRARATLRATAAAFTPSPVVHWAIRRAEIRGMAPAVSEALAGGGGAGVAAAIAKGGAVLTLAGACAGAGGAILSSAPDHGVRHHVLVRSARASATALPASPLARVRPVEVAIALRASFGVEDRSAAAAARRGSRSPFAQPLGQERTSHRSDHGGSADGSSDGSSLEGSEPGSFTGSGSDGGSGAAMASSTGGSPGGASTMGGSSEGGSASVSSGSDGGTGDGGPTASNTTLSPATQTTPDGGSGPALTTTQSAPDGGAGLDGGSSELSSSSGSGDTTPATSSH
jgi:RNA polymerase sigma factor (sigma-70 family)